MNRLNFNKIKINPLSILENLAKRRFLIFMCLSAVAFILAGLVFYKYAYLPDRGNSENSGQEPKINNDDYQKMIDSWQNKAETLEGVDFREFKSPF